MPDDSKHLDRRSFVKLTGAGAASLTVAGCITGGGEGEDDGLNGDLPDNNIVHLEDQAQGSMDPGAMADTIENSMRSHLYDEFLAIDAETFSVEEFIATEWNTEDGLTWTFTIRDDVTKHGGGALTAEDIVYSMDRQLSITGGYGSFWQGRLEEGSTEAVSDTEVEFNFDEPYGPFLASLARFAIVDKDLAQENEQDGDWASDWFEAGNVAGTGPYLIDEFSTSGTTELVGFEDYWRGWEDNQFGSVTIEIIEEASTGMQMMQLGDAHVCNQNLTDDNWQQLASFDNVRVEEDPMSRLYVVHMNTTKEPFTDREVRRAFFHAIDYQNIVDNIIGSGVPAAGPVPRPMGDFHNGDIPVSEQRPDEAQAALEESSYTVDEINDIGVEIQTMAGNPVFEQTGLAMQDNLSEVLGVEIDVSPTQWSTIADAYSSAESSPHMFNSYNSAKFPDAETHTRFMFHPDAFGTYGTGHFFEDDELTDLLDEAATTSDEQERIELYHDIQQIVYDNYPCFWVANPDNRTGLAENIDGYEYVTVVSNTASYELYLDE